MENINQDNLQLCTNCLEFVRESNYDLHEAQCEKMMRQQQEQEKKSQQDQQSVQENQNQMEIEPVQEEQEQEFYQCPQCGSDVNISDIEVHQSNCSEQCRHCQQLFPLQLIDRHYEVCEKKNQQQEQQQQSQQNNNQQQQPFMDYFNGMFSQQQQQYQQQQQNQNQNPGLYFQSFFVPQQQQYQRPQDQQQQQGNIFDNIFQNMFVRQQRNSMGLEDFIQYLLQQEGQRDHSNIGGLSEKEINQLKTLKFQKQQQQQSQEQKGFQNHNECAICLSEFEQDEEIKELCCQHRFHKKCVDIWLKKNYQCPMCKKDQRKVPENKNKQSQGQQFFNPFSFVNGNNENSNSNPQQFQMVFNIF